MLRYKKKSSEDKTLSSKRKDWTTSVSFILKTASYHRFSGFSYQVQSMEFSLLLSNYWPISLLSNIEKIYEKIMYTRLLDFLDANKVIYLKQFGFCKAHLTVTD